MATRKKPDSAPAQPVWAAWAAWKEAPDAIDNLCSQVEDGLSLTDIARSLGVQTSTLTRWIDSDPQRSARARESRARSAALWDERALQGIEDAGNPFDLAKAKERAHHLRWRAAKINPREYGDKLDVTAEVGIKALPDDVLLKRATELAAKLGIGLGAAGGASESQV